MPNDGTGQCNLAAFMFADMPGYNALERRSRAFAFLGGNRRGRGNGKEGDQAE